VEARWGAVACQNDWLSWKHCCRTWSAGITGWRWSSAGLARARRGSKELSRRCGVPYLNLSLALSQRLLPLTSKERPLRVGRLLAEILDEQPGSAVLLDSTELLFEPALRQDPLACLQGASRHKTLVVAWNGETAGAALICAEPGHPEYLRYEHPDVNVIVLP